MKYVRVLICNAKSQRKILFLLFLLLLLLLKTPHEFHYQGYLIEMLRL